MKNVHLVIADLFLPKEFVADICADLHLPALENMLARGTSAKPLAPSSVEGSARADASGVPLESHLCELFGVPCRTGAPIAPISAAFDGLGEGCWLRADPVHLRLQREQLVLLPNVAISADEAAQMCASLNRHFVGQGMEFFAPHPQRWYMRLARLPDIATVPLSQAAGRNVHGLLPNGVEALHWHQLFNEIQMLLFAHPVNEAREVRGELPVNSVWLWGGGCDTLLAKPADCGSSREAAPCVPAVYDTPYGESGGCTTTAPLQKNYQSVSADEVLPEMFAAAAGIPFTAWAGQWSDKESDGRQLLVWNGLCRALQCGDLAVWCDALQGFETGYAQPLWQALRSGKIAQLRIDVLGGDTVRQILLTRADAWAFWRRAKSLAQYSMV